MSVHEIKYPPNTTYTEVTEAVILARAFDPKIMIWAAVFEILLSPGI